MSHQICSPYQMAALCGGGDGACCVMVGGNWWGAAGRLLLLPRPGELSIDRSGSEGRGLGRNVVIKTEGSAD